MTQDAGTGATGQLQRNILARPVAGDAVQTVIGAGPGDRGPWSIITGIPNSDADMMGPPAQYLAVAAWAA
jgi:hypothetical protein